MYNEFGVLHTLLSTLKSGSERINRLVKARMPEAVTEGLDDLMDVFAQVRPASYTLCLHLATVG